MWIELFPHNDRDILRKTSAHKEQHLKSNTILVATMAPKDFTDGLDASLVHHDDQSSCSSCDSDIINLKQKKAVHFYAQCSITLYAMPTETDRANAWYTCDDLLQFKQNSKVIAKAASMGKTIEGEEMMFGLENHFQEKSELKMQRRYLCWDLVMDGQNNIERSLDTAAKCSKVSEGSSIDAAHAATLLRISIFQDQTVAAQRAIVLSRRQTAMVTEQRLCIPVPRGK